MVSDMLNKVLEKEKQTAGNEQEARLQAEEILKQAEIEAKELLSGANAAVKEKAQLAIDAAQKEATLSAQNAALEAQQQADALKAACESKLAETVNAVKAIILQ